MTTVSFRARRCAVFADEAPVANAAAVIEAMIPYIEQWGERGYAASHILRHMLGLFTHQRVAKAWKRFLTTRIQRSLTLHLSCVTPCARYQTTSLIAALRCLYCRVPAALGSFGLRPELVYWSARIAPW